MGKWVDICIIGGMENTGRSQYAYIGAEYHSGTMGSLNHHCQSWSCGLDTRSFILNNML